MDVLTRSYETAGIRQLMITLSWNIETHPRGTILEFLARWQWIWGCILNQRIFDLIWNCDNRLGLVED